MKLICLLLLCVTSHAVDEKVYVCFSKGASRYHYKEHCRGLSACKHVVKKMTIEEAKEFGFTLCKWED